MNKITDINKELALYLKSKSGLQRLMVQLKDKYVSLSRPSGKVEIKNLTSDECLDIGNLLGKKIFEGDNLSVSFREIGKKINEGKEDLSG